jgi:hypothetical protein
MAAGIMNIILFVYSIKKKKEDKSYLKYFIIQAVLEIILYVPWLIYFAIQKLSSGAGFWVKLTFPGTLIEILNFQYKGFADLNFSYSFINMFTFVFAVLIYIYIGFIAYKEIKQKNDIKPAIFALITYIGVIIGALVVSIVIPILFSRYLYVITGFLIFVMAYFLAKEKRTWITVIVLALISCMAIYNNYQLISDNYDQSNMKQVQYMSEEILPDDIIIYSNFSESLMTAYFPENTQYYLNLEKWDIEKAYAAFAPQMKIVEDYEFLNNYTGRIWIVESGEPSLYKEIENSNIVLDAESFSTEYHNYYYSVMLVEKD